MDMYVTRCLSALIILARTSLFRPYEIDWNLWLALPSV